MKKLMIPALVVLAFAVAGCDNEDTIVIEDDAFPATPQGVFSVTGNGTVWVYWNGIYEHDVDYYVVYRSQSETTGYTSIANVDAVSNPDLDLLIYEYQDNIAVNGVTYWYAVTAVDHAGQESDLSAEDVFDTPRPDGMNWTLVPMELSPDLSGFSFVAQQVVPWNSPLADIYMDRILEIVGADTAVHAFLNVGSIDTDIQDLGYTEDFDEISYAPLDGWSRLGYVEVIQGHTYVIWTSDDHYAKLRVDLLHTTGVIQFDWAYQTSDGDYGRLELAPPARPPRDGEYPQPKPAVVMQLIK